MTNVLIVCAHERCGTHLTIDTIRKATNLPAGAIESVRELFPPYCRNDLMNRWAQRCDHWTNRIAMKHRLILKTHQPLADTMEMVERTGLDIPIVYVTRDPRDTLWSWYEYLHRPAYWQHNRLVEQHDPLFKQIRNGLTFDQFIHMPLTPFLRYAFAKPGEAQNTPATVLERLCEHGRALRPDENRRAPIFTTYASMLLEPGPTLARVADATGWKIVNFDTTPPAVNTPQSTAVLPSSAPGIGRSATHISVTAEREIIDEFEYTPLAEGMRDAVFLGCDMRRTVRSLYGDPEPEDQP